ncbi:MAG: hypothetical protein ACLT9S_00105 [Faecalibacterium sp.]
MKRWCRRKTAGKVRLNIHLPRLESATAPDAARINAGSARLYEYDAQGSTQT